MSMMSFVPQFFVDTHGRGTGTFWLRREECSLSDKRHHRFFFINKDETFTMIVLSVEP